MYFPIKIWFLGIEVETNTSFWSISGQYKVKFGSFSAKMDVYWSTLILIPLIQTRAFFVARLLNGQLNSFFSLSFMCTYKRECQLNRMDLSRLKWVKPNWSANKRLIFLLSYFLIPHEPQIEFQCGQVPHLCVGFLGCGKLN